MQELEEIICPHCKHLDRPDWLCDLCKGIGYYTPVISKQTQCYKHQINMFNNKLYKPTLIVDEITIYIPNTKILTGLCGREIIAKQNGLDLNSLAHKNKIANKTYLSIKYN